jgi:hypothetical protein
MGYELPQDLVEQVVSDCILVGFCDLAAFLAGIQAIDVSQVAALPPRNS